MTPEIRDCTKGRERGCTMLIPTQDICYQRSSGTLWKRGERESGKEGVGGYKEIVFPEHRREAARMNLEKFGQCPQVLCKPKTEKKIPVWRGEVGGKSHPLRKSF